MTMKKKSFTIDRATWRCGGREQSDKHHGSGATLMLNEEGFKCCLGHIASQCGFTDKQLFNHGRPSQVVKGAGTKPTGFLTETDNSNIVDSLLTHAAIAINDDENISFEERETELAKIFRNAGYEISFIGKYNR